MSSPIHKIVMRRIQIIYILGLILNTTTLAVVVAVIALGAVVHVVHVGSVLTNMPHITSGIASEQFLITAFAHTRFVTQIAVISLLGVASYFIYTAISTFRSMSFTRTA